jgi:hypothetical protein
MTTAGSVIEWKWSVEASGWRRDYDARGYVESVRKSWFDTCPMSKNDRIKSGRTNVQKTLQALKNHGYECYGGYVPVAPRFRTEARCPIEKE